MSFVNVWIHAVWGTKNRALVLTKEKRVLLFEHIRSNARAKGILVNAINGYHDHVHCLFRLPSELSLAKALQLIKGEASHWANAQKLVLPKLEWADEYFAASVSESVLEKVHAYINNQEEHHRKMSFAQEYRLFIERFNHAKEEQQDSDQ